MNDTSTNLVYNYKAYVLWEHPKGQGATRGTFKENYLDVKGKMMLLCERRVSHTKSEEKSILGRGNSMCKGHGPGKQPSVFSAGPTNYAMHLTYGW